MSDTPSPDVAAHYGRPDLIDTLAGALRAAGKQLESLRPEDLTPIDQLHLRGREATLELAHFAGISSADSVLDVGGGLGGPARTLAAELRCRVTVLDLTPEFVSTGRELTRWVGLGGRVTFEEGTALALPFAAGAFDVVWMQHSAMNIPDKPRLYAEAHRVLRPAGRLALHDIMGGSGGPLDFPVPWASRSDLSFLLPAAEIRACVREAGFRERAWQDVTAVSLAWLEQRLADGGPGPLGPQLLAGEVARPAFTNLRDALADGRVRVVEGVFERA